MEFSRAYFVKEGGNKTVLRAFCFVAAVLKFIYAFY